MSKRDEPARGRWTIGMRHTSYGSLRLTVVGSCFRISSLSLARAWCRKMNAGRTRDNFLYFVRRSDRRLGV